MIYLYVNARLAINAIDVLLVFLTNFVRLYFNSHLAFLSSLEIVAIVIDGDRAVWGK